MVVVAYICSEILIRSLAARYRYAAPAEPDTVAGGRENTG